jgi:tetratricopeptide (TPR) repeat protein
MPARVWMNVHFHTDDDQYVPPIRRHEHRIAVYPEARQEVLLAWYRTQTDAHSRQEAAGLTRSLVGHWLTEADTRRRDYRFLAAIGAVREALRLDPAPATHDRLRQAVAVQARLDADWAEALHQADERRYPEAIATLEKVLAVKPDWAPARGKLGTLYAATGQKVLAVQHLREVTRSDPDDPYGWNMLGWMAYLDDRAEEAADDFRRADEVEPFTAEIKFRWGLALAKLGRWAEAEQYFRQALAVDPNSVGACQGLAHALRQQGQAAGAVRFARRAARLTQYRNPDVLLGLAETYADAGRFAEADDTAERALEAARAGDPKLVPQIRLRQDEMRARSRK